MRSHPLRHYAHAAKIAEVEQFVRTHWRTALTICKEDKLKRLREGYPISRLLREDWNLGKPEYLTARQWKDVENQVNAALRSWQELAIIEGRKVINDMVAEARRTDNPLEDERVHRLRSVNVRAAWWKEGETELISRILKRCPFPVFANTSAMIVTDNLNGWIGESSHTVHGTWFTLRLAHGRKVHLPVERTDYFTRKMTDHECAVTAITVRDGVLDVRRVNQSPVAEVRTEGSDIGVDWGLAALVSTSDGQVFGTAHYCWLKERDAELIELDRHYRRLGVKPSAQKRYVNLQRRVREYVKNEVGRVLNTLAETDIRSVTVESLNFRGGGLSRKLNRIVTRAGRAAFRAKLADLTDTHGVSVTEVNPAYSSQECSGCGFVHGKNRRSQREFRCGFCGKKIHADINASRAISYRRSWVDGMRYHRKEAVLAYLDSVFRSRWGVEPSRIRERCEAGFR